MMRQVVRAQVPPHLSGRSPVYGMPLGCAADNCCAALRADKAVVTAMCCAQEWQLLTSACCAAEQLLRDEWPREKAAAAADAAMHAAHERQRQLAAAAAVENRIRRVLVRWAVGSMRSCFLAWRGEAAARPSPLFVLGLPHVTNLTELRLAPHVVPGSPHVVAPLSQASQLARRAAQARAQEQAQEAPARRAWHDDAARRARH